MKKSAFDVEFTIVGLRDLEKKLRVLPTALAGKALRSALMAGMTPIQKAAKQKVAKRSGALEKAISKQSTLLPKSYAAEAGIRMRTGKGKAGWRWHLEEFGYTRVASRGDLKANRRFIAKRRRTGGNELSPFGEFVPARPFLRPAFDENKEKALLIVRDKLAQNIYKQAKSLTPLPPPATEPDD